MTRLPIDAIPQQNGGEVNPNKLSWIDELFFELSRDEAVRELLGHLSNRIEYKTNKILAVGDIITNLLGG